MNASFGERGEGEDRELFARRARALPLSPVPALASILAAAEAPEPRRLGVVDGGRAWGAAVAVAACFAALFVPRGELVDREVNVSLDDTDGARAAGEMCVASPDEDLRLAACVAPDEPRMSRVPSTRNPAEFPAWPSAWASPNGTASSAGRSPGTPRAAGVSRFSTEPTEPIGPGEQVLVCVNETSCRLRGP